jgi:hypothetical protein
MEEFNTAFLNELEKRVSHYGYWYHLFWVLNDWLFMIGLIITVATPFCFFLLLYIPLGQHNFYNIIFVIITGIGTIINIIRSALKLEDRARHNLNLRTQLNELLMDCKFGHKKFEELLSDFKNIERMVADEPSPR